MGGVNIFHVGYDIELWLVVLCLTVLALAIVLFDRALHHAQHALLRHPKYHDMLAKALGELMVFGLVALVMKIVKVTQTHETEVMVAFQAADMMMFLMAVALIVQSISVFGQLRTKNLEMDEAELHSSEELLRMRDPWHFVVISFFALNALYIAFFLMCVAHLTDTAFRLHGMLALMALPLPLLVNLGYFQPRMFRDFILVSGVHQLDTSAMFEVTKRLEQTLDGRTEFVDAVLQYLDEHSLNVDDVKAALADQDPESTGLVSVEGVRVVLSNHGFSMSRFRFNSIVRLLFPVQAAKIEYAVIVHMLSVGQDASTQCSSGSQRRRCNLALPSYESVQTLDLSSSDLDIVQPTLQQQRSLRFVKASRVASAPALVQPTTAQIRRLLTLESM
ncbi:TPA: hypothetical protein N0F65_000782 [Lagenidium giganteum]|uniref:RGS domain-containing protein n=1 Tax=Lagenidium giganteum TaxID=4803 RepID=A0AAV2ZHU4_9STRA|nr:TPA: hypothetical protein N0F65_000782 [Lagenidium giganteum]